MHFPTSSLLSFIPSLMNLYSQCNTSSDEPFFLWSKSETLEISFLVIQSFIQTLCKYLVNFSPLHSKGFCLPWGYHLVLLIQCPTCCHSPQSILHTLWQSAFWKVTLLLLLHSEGTHSCRGLMPACLSSSSTLTSKSTAISDTTLECLCTSPYPFSP